jgi:signal peptidase I
MEPNLHNGEILVLRKTQSVKEGDIIAFYYNNQVLVRRVISTGGKQLSIAEDGTVSVNGIVQEEKYLENPSLGQCNIDFPYHVRTGYVFVMGDNRETAMDSRVEEIGLIPVGRIIGKVIFTI